jgi:ABC-2 type transport system permease protein
MAHQWWGHQVTEANVKGNAMLSESLSQYSALMVMKEKYPPEMMQKFLRYELDRYLRGRASETKKEQPLALVESQSYIHYRKGSLVMYALQDYIGEDSVNMALKRYLQAWANREDRYPTTADLLPYFEEVTPDSLKYLIRDYFETITLYENRAMEPSYEKQSDESYLVEVPVKAMKYRADSLGNESEIAMSDWIDIGVYTESAGGEDSLLYLQKHKITEPEMTFAIEVDALPSKAGIDPLFKLIDRNPSDNVSRVIEK